jgi:hypothetical protein
MGNYSRKAFIKEKKTMSIFKSNEGEMARFERHMKPIRAMQENRRLKLIRNELKKELQLQRKGLRALKSEQAKLEQELKSFSPLQLELPLKRL